MRFSLFPALILSLVASVAEAQSAPPSTPRGDAVVQVGKGTRGSAAAQEHFERALTFYRAGKYRAAEAELNEALERDPHGKDLVFNLALVQEKLGDLSGAIETLQRFQRMEKDPAELERAAQAIERLEGARAELPSASPPSAGVPASVPTPRAALSRGRWDGWVIGAGTFSAASFLVGAILAVRTLSLDADAEPRKARDSAIMANFSFATSLLAGAGTAVLYFGRFADTPPAHAALPPLPHISTAWLELRY